MTKTQLEENQIRLYAVALIAGVCFGLWYPTLGSNLEFLISPVLAVLLYGMFAQIPLFRLSEAFLKKRFTAALLIVNFAIVPIVVWLLSLFLPDDPSLLLGVYLVLLTPCIDYVVVFTHLGRGNAQLVLASTPLLLFFQILLLPVYLWIFMGEQTRQVMNTGPFLEAFLIFIVFPLGLALLTRFWAKRQSSGAVWLEVTAWFPVLFMALTLLFVIASQIGRIGEYLEVVKQIVPIYVAFMVIMPFLASLTAFTFRLDSQAGRALIFSAGTRNSLVVLPLALSLPDISILVSVVIITQTLVELVGELIYIHLVPAIIFQEPKI